MVGAYKMRLWEIGIPYIGGRALALAQLDGLLKDRFLEPIAESVARKPDSLHVLERGLFDAAGRQLPIPDRCVWKDLSDMPEGHRTFYFQT